MTWQGQSQQEFPPGRLEDTGVYLRSVYCRGGQGRREGAEGSSEESYLTFSGYVCLLPQLTRAKGTILDNTVECTPASQGLIPRSHTLLWYNYESIFLMFQALRYWTLNIVLLVLETATGALSFLVLLLTTTASFLSGPGLSSYCENSCEEHNTF